LSLTLNSASTIPWVSDAVASIQCSSLFFGPDPKGLGGFEIGIATASHAVTVAEVRQLHKARLKGRDASLVVAVVTGERVSMLGPDTSLGIQSLSVDAAARQLQAALDESDSLQAARRFLSLSDAENQTQMSGVRNRGLFATYHLRENTKRRPDWSRFQNDSRKIVHSRSRQLIQDLGFVVSETSNHAMVLNDSRDTTRAVALLLDESESFDGESSRFHSSPVSWGLSVAAEQGVPWLIMLRREQLRLYPARDGVGVGQKGQTETYLELDLAALADEYLGLLTLVFSAEALGEKGSAQELLDESVRYATALGTRLRERIYDQVVPDLSKAVALEMRQLGTELDASGLQDAYRTTLRILFRFLFQAYAEDRGLLPSGRNQDFDAHSLTSFASGLADQSTKFTEESTLWVMLQEVWEAIDVGNESWRVPAYNGGLFGSDPDLRPYGALIKKLSLPDSVIGPALKALLIDNTEDGVAGMVDFRSLSVREFGTIYEGLLESSLSLAESDLTIDKNGAWLFAGPNDTVEARQGEPYFHNTSGERKATGSYFTPDFIVDHLIERSIDPSLQNHLSGIKELINQGKHNEAAKRFFDYRVADLAMGSAHFLVAAVDRIESKMRSFLAQPGNEIAGVSNELERLAEAARKALGDDLVAIDDIDDAVLLRRQIARRCVYGIDINPLAVELSRLAIWIHTFVPGLPMSTLDHNLVCANSLIGVSTVDELVSTLFREAGEGEFDLQSHLVQEALDKAASVLAEATALGEATVAEVAMSREATAGASRELSQVLPLFDLAISVISKVVKKPEVFALEELLELAGQAAVQQWVAGIQPAHFPLLFPQVFSGVKRGFDVIIGNPPWEELVVDSTAFWAAKSPGLKSRRVQDRDALIKELEVTRAQEFQELTTRIADLEKLRRILLAKFPIKTGDFDLFKAFAWQALRLCSPESGTISLVLPKTAFSAAGLERWRRESQTAGSIESIVFLVNSNKWVFDIHPQYSIALVQIALGHNSDLSLFGPFHSREEFDRGIQEEPGRIAHDRALAFTKSGSIPVAGNAISASILNQIRLKPSLDEFMDGRVRPAAEFHATTARRFFDHGEGEGRIKVLTGASFNVWQPQTGTVFAWADPEIAVAELSRRFLSQSKHRSSAMFGLDLQRDYGGRLPFERPRIAIRGVTNPTNSRTLIPALVSGGQFLINTAPYLVLPPSATQEEAFLLGIMSSLPFDWYSRRFIETSVNFHLLSAFPVPPLVKDRQTARIVHLAGSLAAVGDAYAEWAEAVGVAVGTLQEEGERNDAIYELDALVSLAYGLDRPQVEHIFETFHRGWDYAPRLAKVFEFFDEWKANS